MDGILNVYKEKGYTSHDVVAKLRGIFHQKKIGHTGTLDPDATGVLPVCLGKATKVCGLLTDKTKRYTAVVCLGVITDTQDMSGQILEERPVCVTKEQILKTAQCFQGERMQTPPMYSAVKVNGKRLYELARQGVEVERKQRKIQIYSCEITDFQEEKNEFTMDVHCSKGTYIRTLCHDMGEALSCGACMKSLVRTQVDSFSLEQAYTLSQIEKRYAEGGIGEILYPIDSLFMSCPEVTVLEEGLKLLKNGNPVNEKFCKTERKVQDAEMVRMYDEQKGFYALYTYSASTHQYLNHKMFV